MISWIIYSKSLKVNNTPSLQTKFEINNHMFCLNENKVYKSYVSHNKKEGLFIFGYILPRLQYEYSQHIALELLNEIKIGNESYLNNFKGNFLIICFYDNKLLLFNDQLGINKYFFYQVDDVFLASDKLVFISKNIPLKISKINIVKYYLFNYFIDGITIYENCHYSKPGTCYKVNDTYKMSEYFSINEFIDERKIKYTTKESISIGADLWKKIINQYIEYFKDKNISQTLTAGIDSRLILAGFRANHFYPDTFTFGKKDSLDVKHAEKIAKKLKSKHYHLYPEEEFFCNYHKKAKEVISLSSGMSTLYRAHRLDAYRKMKNIYGVLFFGFIGSEIVRGLYPDGLTVPKIVTDYWIDSTININKYYPKHWIQLTNAEFLKIEAEIKDYDFVQRPDLFLFKCMIPLHFAQDIALNESLGMYSVAPYWDLDFLEFQKHTPFFTDNKRKEEFAKKGHFSRRNGPFYSANMLYELDKENARMSLGKGYSPADYSCSMYYAAIKFAFFKLFFKKRYKIPNFNYEKWFKNYLNEFITCNKIDFVNIDVEKTVKTIQSLEGSSESDYLDFVKLINIQLIDELKNE